MTPTVKPPGGRSARLATAWRCTCRACLPCSGSDLRSDSGLRPPWWPRQPVDPKNRHSRRPGEKHCSSFSRRARSSSSCGTRVFYQFFVKDRGSWPHWSSLNALFQHCRRGAAVWCNRQAGDNQLGGRAPLRNLDVVRQTGITTRRQPTLSDRATGLD